MIPIGRDELWGKQEGPAFIEPLLSTRPSGRTSPGRSPHGVVSGARVNASSRLSAGFLFSVLSGEAAEANQLI